jgi:hypothetical protein
MTDRVGGRFDTRRWRVAGQLVGAALLERR